MRIPTLEEFIEQNYKNLQEDKRPSGFYGCMAWFHSMHRKYKEMYEYDDGK